MNDEAGRYVEHEIRIRIQEQTANDIKQSLQNIENKIHNDFTFMVGLILVSIIIPVVFHMLKWM